jgi:nucleoside-diphosphate-sugar epimerase
MRVLVAGLTGQLGHGIVAQAAAHGVELVPVVRPLGRRSGPERARRLFRDAPELARRAIEGDVARPLWGLPEAAVADLRGSVDAVLDLAAETNWAAPAQGLVRANVAGAVNAVGVARGLSSGDRAPVLCYASSIHAAGSLEGRIPELPFAPDGRRTPYEQSKWLAEGALLDPVRCAGGPPIAIARIGGLVGDSRSGATVRRNSLYMLTNPDYLPPGRLLPLTRGGRVDMLPRDVAGDLVLRLLAGLRRDPPARTEIVHLCAGESAPTTASLLAALRSADSWGAVRRPRPLPAPVGVTTWLSEHLDRAQSLSVARRNAVIGLRYLAFDRLFERARLRRWVGEPLPTVTADQLARLAFGISAEAAPPWPAETPLARFAG